MTATKTIPIPFKVSEEEKSLIDAALVEAKKENHLFSRTSMLVWLVRQYLEGSKGKNKSAN